jgi:hypothetical protein
LRSGDDRPKAAVGGKYAGKFTNDYELRTPPPSSAVAWSASSIRRRATVDEFVDVLGAHLLKQLDDEPRRDLSKVVSGA